MTISSVKSPALAELLDHIRNQIRSESIEIPMLPEVAGRVLRTTQDPESAATDLAKLIQGDQSLAAHVMRIANSAAYSPSAAMVSLQQAITRLGMKVIAEIALAASLHSSLFNTPGFERHIQYILNYSLASGLWAKETARACRKNVEAAFLSGLLHDIGRPLAVQLALEIARHMRIRLREQDIFQIEHEVQRELGIKVLEQWGMPSTVINVVKYFDNYEQEHEGQLQTKIVVAGTAVAAHFMANAGEDYCPNHDELLAHPVFASINMYPDEVEQLLEREDIINSTMEAMSP